MSIKWLDCTVIHNPDAAANKQYTCTFTDYNSRSLSVKVGSTYVYVDYLGPPGAPYICRGELRVELHDDNGDRAIILLPVRGSHDDNVAYVPSRSIQFKPPDQLKTVCVFRRRR